MPSMTKEFPKNSSLHQMLATRLMSRVKYAMRRQGDQHTRWQKAEDSVLAYVPESDLDTSRRSARENRGEPKYTTIKLPYSFAVLMSYHTYVTSVFFGRSPIHQFSGRHGESEQQVQALEALISYQVEVGRLLGPYYLQFYDAGKYGVGVLEEYWANDEIQFSSIQEQADEMNPEGPPVKVQVRVKMPGYSGNRVNNISPFDFLPDPRVPVGRFQEGEFVAVRKRLSWETIVRRRAQGFYMNTDQLGSYEHRSTDGGGGSAHLVRPDHTENVTLDEGDSKHPALVTVYEVHISLIPSEWKLGNSDFPEKWVFTITDDFGTIIGCQPHGAAHGEFPFSVIESEIEAYGSWNRGVIDVLEPIQNTMDWLINTHFFNVRAALNNQFIIDPSKIVAKDAEDGGPGFRYRLRPEAYGTDVRSFFHQIPVQDVTRGNISDVQMMLGFGERITGVNDQIMGVLAQGGRKTATEVRTSTGFGVNRQKTIAEYISHTGFSAHSQRLVQNSQQHYDAMKKLRIVGTLAQDMGDQALRRFLDVRPDDIQGFYDFVPVDGTLPVDRLAMANMWKELLLQMRNVPGLLLRYDLGRIFSYVANLMGVRNIGQFKIELGSPAALMQQAQAGNIVPLSSKTSGPGNKPSGVPASSPVMG